MCALQAQEVLPDLVFPRELILGCQNDLLLPEEQVIQLMGILDGQDVLVSARLDRYACTGQVLASGFLETSLLC